MVWERLPVDDVGYFSASDLDRMTDAEIVVWASEFERRRYGGWRNVGDGWRRNLGLDSTHGKRVIDYGCGLGIEALQFARQGNSVTICDLHEDTVKFASRVIRCVTGVEPIQKICHEGPPFFEVAAGETYDVFYSNGVLHHTPHIREILSLAESCLSESGEIRLMIYSDRAWTVKTGKPLPPIDERVDSHPAFRQFVQAMDGSASWYADWYSREKIALVAEGILDVKSFDYISKDEIYAVAVLCRRWLGSRQ